MPHTRSSVKAFALASFLCSASLFPVYASASENPDPDPSETSVPVSDEYGSAAYSFLETFTGDFPRRLNEENNRSQSLNDAGLWIADQLEGFGYEVQTQDYVHFNYTGTNYYVIRDGRSDKMVCIGAHYDCVDTDGVDDNGSGVSVLLELAQRFSQEEPPCTLIFAFFDNEEYGGYVGSFNFSIHLLEDEGMLDDVLCYINLDSIGGGDRLFAYGGVYEEDGTLDKLWPYQLAQAAADTAGIPLYSMPEEVASNPDDEIAFCTPTRVKGSDHYYFMTEGVPYVYFEAALWCDPDGGGGNTDTRLTCHYQTADLAFASTGGQIMHTEMDNLETLNRLLPGRVKQNLSHVSQIVTSMLREINENTPEDMADVPYSAEPKETEEPETTKEPETTFPETTEMQTFAETESVMPAGNNQSRPTLSSMIENHGLVLLIFGFTAAVILLLIGFIIYLSTAQRRRRRRRSRMAVKHRKKNF